MADAADSKSAELNTREGSSPSIRIKIEKSLKPNEIKGFRDFLF